MIIEKVKRSELNSGTAGLKSKTDSKHENSKAIPPGASNVLTYINLDPYGDRLSTQSFITPMHSVGDVKTNKTTKLCRTTALLRDFKGLLVIIILTTRIEIEVVTSLSFPVRVF